MTATVATTTSPTFEEIKTAVRQLTPEQRVDLREELSFLDRTESPEFRQKLAETIDRTEAGERGHTLEELERHWDLPEEPPR